MLFWISDAKVIKKISPAVLFEHLRGKIFRDSEISKGKSLHWQCPIALGISAATPELPAGVDAFLRHPLDHRLPASRA